MQGYAEMKLPRFPTLQPIISHYQQGEDALGPYWQQPGTSPSSLLFAHGMG